MKRVTQFFLFILLVTVFSSPLYAKKKYKYGVSVAAIFRNEAKWMKEWIEYHRLIGIEHFYLYNNLSTDHYKKVLEPYIKKDIVKLYEWPEESTSVDHWTRIQTDAYTHAIRKAKGVSRWLAVLDLDEFIVPVHHDNLMSFLRNYENYGGLAVHWQLFGTSDVEKVPDDKLMIETLTWKGDDNYGENAFIKSIFHPHHVEGMTDPHKPIYKHRKFQINSRKNRVSNSTNWIFDIEHIRINHYWTRDIDYFYNKKRPRREGWLEGFGGQLHRANNLHHVQDDVILRFVPELRKKMGLE